LTGRRHNASTVEQIAQFFEDCVATCLANFDRNNNDAQYQRCLDRCSTRFMLR